MVLFAILLTMAGTACAATVAVTGESLNEGTPPVYASGDTIQVTGATLSAAGWETLALATSNFALEFENGQTSIPGKAMYNNGYLTSLTANDVTTVGADAFAASVLTNVTLPAATAIGEAAFATSDLASASLPVVKTIETRAFSGTPLTSVSLPAATEIGDFAFNECTRLTSVSLPVAATVGTRAFYGSGLTSVTLPAATAIGSQAFLGSSQLKSATLPVVKTIGDRAFEGCVTLGELHLDDADPTTGTDAFKSVPSGLLIYTSKKALKGTAYPDGYRLVTSGEDSGGGGCNTGIGGVLAILAAWTAGMAGKRGHRKGVVEDK
ncbi:MAG: leucine-rich repeat domain-containing protein [Synergistaceae bacterium]|nr:leucine-rich repeat domain-containing protein [Synergistaceae bacterium]